MTRTEFKRRLPGYIATGLVILTTSIWTFWRVGEMHYEGWGTPFPESLFYLIPGMACLVPPLVVLTRPPYGLALTEWLFRCILRLKEVYLRARLHLKNVVNKGSLSFKRGPVRPERAEEVD